MLLKYSEKKYRESNNGLLKAMGGIGASMSPLLASIAMAFVDYWLVYITVAAMVAITTPLIYWKLIKSAQVFKEEDRRMAEEGNLGAANDD
jgi:uncharacterized membrane-anchored protein